jgi:CheY-like chemotaxis protein
MTLTLSHSARNIFNLLENLLEWSQMQEGHTAFNPQIQDLKELFNESTKIVNDSARNKAIEISIDIPKELEVFADTNMLQTVIRNLVSNAIKFTRHGGRITISAGPGENNTVVIAVKDTGIGMSNEMLDNLFRIDVKSGRRGTEGEPSTGLGLLLCKEFIEKHGGKIWVESEEGKGSVFYFTLPYNGVPKEKIVIKNVVKEDGAESQIIPEGSGLKILIAEDDKISEKLITLAVKRFSKEVIKVRTGVEAVETFRNNPDIDLILMDIKMPEMDGYNAVRQIRQFNKDVIIIAQTAFALNGDREKAIAEGCNDYISKPIDKALLTELP